MSEQTKSAKATTTTESTETTETAQTPMTTETVIEAILSSLSHSSFTAYQIHTVINAAYAILDLGKSIEPQRMYQSAKLGQIDGIKHVKGDNPRYTVEQVKQFAINFIEGSLKSGGTSSRIEMKSLIAAASAKLTK